MTEYDIRRIPIENLLVNPLNPRFEACENQFEALSTIAHKQGVGLVKLAEDLAEKGPNPSELLIASPLSDSSSFLVMEGNRRVAALKLVSTPALVASLNLPSRLTKRYLELHSRFSDSLPRELWCSVMAREDANYWIKLRHTGENAGVGIVSWNALQTSRFLATSPAYQAYELVKASPFLTDDIQKRLPEIPITSLERILSGPEARRFLGIDVKGSTLVFIAPEDEATARLAMVVTDLISGQVDVPRLEKVENRTRYAEEVASRPLPKSTAVCTTGPTTANASSNAAKSSTTTSTRSKNPLDRKSLIPSRLHLKIGQPRIYCIYSELRTLDLNKFVNSGAVLFRVFLELSANEFANRNGIPLTKPSKRSQAPGATLTTIDMTLGEKLRTVTDFMVQNNRCTKEEAQGIRAIIAKRDEFPTMDILNAYSHNEYYSPMPIELKTIWGNIQAFMERMWA